MVFVKFPEILVKGHSAFSTSRLDKMKVRAQFSNYILQPTKFNFRKVTRIIASIFAFSEKWDLFVKKSETKFRMFSVKFRDDGDTRKSELTEEKFDACFNEEESVFAENEKISEESVISWYASICRGAEGGQVWISQTRTWTSPWPCNTGTRQVARKSSSSMRRSSSIRLQWRKKILFCKRKIMDGHRFITTAGLNEDNLGNEVQLNIMTPSPCWIGTVSLPTASPASSTIRWDKHESC